MKHFSFAIGILLTWLPALTQRGQTAPFLFDFISPSIVLPGKGQFSTLSNFHLRVWMTREHYDIRTILDNRRTLSNFRAALATGRHWPGAEQQEAYEHDSGK